MSITRRTFLFIVLGLVVWASVASLSGAYYYYLYNDLFQKTRRTVIHVNLGVNYGNGTVKWFNMTEARGGDTLLGVTLQKADVNYTTSTFGALISSINDVENSGSKAWIWWTHNRQFGWTEGPIASDRYVLGDNETAYWYYEDVSTWPYATPP